MDDGQFNSTGSGGEPSNYGNHDPGSTEQHLSGQIPANADERPTMALPLHIPDYTTAAVRQPPSPINQGRVLQWQPLNPPNVPNWQGHQASASFSVDYQNVNQQQNHVIHYNYNGNNYHGSNYHGNNYHPAQQNGMGMQPFHAAPIQPHTPQQMGCYGMAAPGSRPLHPPGVQNMEQYPIWPAQRYSNVTLPPPINGQPQYGMNCQYYPRFINSHSNEQPQGQALHDTSQANGFFPLQEQQAALQVPHAPIHGDHYHGPAAGVQGQHFQPDMQQQPLGYGFQPTYQQQAPLPPPPPCHQVIGRSGKIEYEGTELAKYHETTRDINHNMSFRAWSKNIYGPANAQKRAEEKKRKKSQGKAAQAREVQAVGSLGGKSSAMEARLKPSQSQSRVHSQRDAPYPPVQRGSHHEKINTGSGHGYQQPRYPSAYPTPGRSPDEYRSPYPAIPSASAGQTLPAHVPLLEDTQGPSPAAILTIAGR